MFFLLIHNIKYCIVSVFCCLFNIITGIIICILFCFFLKKRTVLYLQMLGLDVMMSICNMFLTPAQWVLHTSLALWWRRWWRFFPAPGSTLGSVDWSLVEDGRWDPTGQGRQGRDNEGVEGGRCWSKGAQGKGGEGKGKGQLSFNSTLSSFMYLLTQQHLSCPEGSQRKQQEKISGFNQLVRKGI